VRSPLDTVEEPRLLPDGRRDPESIVLGVHERLEVVKDDGLPDLVDLLESECLQEQAVSTESCGKTSHGRSRTTQTSRQLAVGAAGHEPCGYGK
jgi:hypothetical protein